MRWVVQTNLGREYVDDLKEACKVNGYEFVSQFAIPFSHEVPDLDRSIPTVFYGATNWINEIYLENRQTYGLKWKPGVFFNSSSTFEVWRKAYGEHCLSYEAEMAFIRDLQKKDFPDDKLFFIRPTSDMKEFAFAGTVMSFGEIKDWASRLTGDMKKFGWTHVLYGEPYNIRGEWRLFIVDGKVSTGSMYRMLNRTEIRPTVPEEVIEFAEARTKEYAPEPVFVMDVGLCGGKLYVIEIGCINSAGFYASDVTKLVKDVSEYCLRQQGT